MIQKQSLACLNLLSVKGEEDYSLAKLFSVLGFIFNACLVLPVVSPNFQAVTPQKHLMCFFARRRPLWLARPRPLWRRRGRHFWRRCGRHFCWRLGRHFWRGRPHHLRHLLGLAAAVIQTLLSGQITS